MKYLRETDLLSFTSKSRRGPYFPQYFLKKSKFFATYSKHAGEEAEQLGLIKYAVNIPNSIFCREDIWPCIEKVMMTLT